MPFILIVAGPNGAGKSTFARQLLAGSPGTRFVNADDIARDLPAGASPSARNMQAGRDMITLLDALIAARADIILETTLATRRYPSLQGPGRDQSRCHGCEERPRPAGNHRLEPLTGMVLDYFEDQTSREQASRGRERPHEWASCVAGRAMVFPARVIASKRRPSAACRRQRPAFPRPRPTC